MKSKNSILKNYAGPLTLIGSILLGSLLGFFLKGQAVVIKPLGDIFLNLLFAIVVPMVFFSISSAVASTSSLGRLKKIFLWMILIFIVTGFISSAIMVAAVKAYPPATGVKIALPTSQPIQQIKPGEQIVRAFTVPDFVDLLSKKNMLAMIIFSILVGLATSKAGERGRVFRDFLLAGNEVMTQVVAYIMIYAPVGLGAYFAYLVGAFGPELLGSYLRVIRLYYPIALLYFLIAFSLYSFLAAGREGVRKFWVNIIPPSLTAWATGSSIATIPTNLEAARRIGTPQDIREVVIPVGATIHMEGSCLAAIVKIAFLFGIFQMDFSGIGTILMAIGIAILAGTVISGIPAGGMLGELLIVTMYGFPIEALPIISMIGTIVDPPATMVNAVGDNVASMMVARILGGRDWIRKGKNEGE
jgi:Na+/H+-dicarboxylate symporter